MALDYSIIGERIRKARLEKKLTQENLAEKINVSVAFISRIERGNAHINLTRLSQICNILNIDEGLILNGTSLESENYLADDFYTLLKSCSTETQKLIYDIAKIIIANQNN
jgi:transcriptional regulator with XRE-family HTH domain